MSDKWTPAKIKELRKAFGESQEQFARRLRVSIGTVAAWEQAKSNPTGLAQAYLDRLEEDIIAAAVAGKEEP